jgi:hypothetical protein
MNVSRTGMLLLNKQDSIRLRAVHESILNDLRVHGVLLPFDFGTVALGKDRLLDKIDENLSELQTALEVLQGTSVWTLSVFVLDARIAQFVGPEGMTVRREPEKNRQSYHPPAQIGKIDIKVLERILGKEKKIAEAMHEEMRQAAERAEVNLMVGLGSGSSDDWKLILKASYEVLPSNVGKLNKTLTDLQYDHFLYEPMLHLAGNVDVFSFRN